VNKSEILKKIDDLLSEYYKTSQEESLQKKLSLSELLYDEKEWSRAIHTMLGGWISQGPNVKQFESEFSRYCQCQHGLAVNSGSSANLLALLSLKKVYNLKDGDEVILPASTFATVAMPVIQAGLVPVYVDICEETLNMDPREVEKAISPRTKVIMVVHTLGYPADVEALLAIANEHDCHVLEDCCEAHGSSINGKKVGSFGDIATFSFFVAHNMTTGEGGMIVTNNKKLDNVCRSLREFGRISQENLKGDNRYYSDDVLTEYDRRYVFENLGYNLRMTDISAAFGIEQLKKLDSFNLRRRANATLVSELIEKQAGHFFSLTREKPGYFHTYYGFPILLKPTFPFSRKELTQFLEEKGVETRPLFAGCLPDQPGLRNQKGRTVGNLENARNIRDRAFFIGIHPALRESQIQDFVDHLESFTSAKVESL